MKTRSTLPFNLDRKLAGTILSGAIVYVLVTVIGLDVSEDVKASISTVSAFAVGYLLPPSDIEAA